MFPEYWKWVVTISCMGNNWSSYFTNFSTLSSITGLELGTSLEWDGVAPSLDDAVVAGTEGVSSGVVTCGGVTSDVALGEATSDLVGVAVVSSLLEAAVVWLVVSLVLPETWSSECFWKVHHLYLINSLEMVMFVLI